MAIVRTKKNQESLMARSELMDPIIKIHRDRPAVELPADFIERQERHARLPIPVGDAHPTNRQPIARA
jgi:hypothetical protein